VCYILPLFPLILRTYRNLLSGGRLETMAHASIEKGIEACRKKAKNKEAFDPREILTLQVYNIICAMCFDIK
jgi:hypothetical protein